MSYKGGQTLKNEQYANFVLSHILRPFQTMIAPEGKIRTQQYYGRIPDLAEENPEWWEFVMDRLSRCYARIEHGVIADDRVGRFIEKELRQRGVKFVSPVRSIRKVES